MLCEITEKYKYLSLKIRKNTDLVYTVTQTLQLIYPASSLDIWVVSREKDADNKKKAVSKISKNISRKNWNWKQSNTRVPALINFDKQPCTLWLIINILTFCIITIFFSYTYLYGINCKPNVNNPQGKSKTQNSMFLLTGSPLLWMINDSP